MNKKKEKNNYLESGFIQTLKMFCKANKIDFVDDYRLIKKTKLKASSLWYEGRLYFINYPNGFVPRGTGISCTIPSLREITSFFGGNTAAKKYLNEKIGLIKRNDFENPQYIYKIKEWCNKNKIKTINDFKQKTNGFKKERIPTYPKLKRILGNKTKEFLINKIELLSSSSREKFLQEEFINKIKKHLTKNNIIYASDYDKKRDKSWMPTRERFRQVLGANFVYKKLGLKAKKGKNKNYTNIEDLKTLLKSEEIYSIIEYKSFKEKHDLSNETPLPPAHMISGGFAKLLGLSKKELKEKKLKKTYFSYKTKNLKTTDINEKKIELITKDTSLDRSKKMYLLLMFFDENEIAYNLESLATLVKDNYPNWNTFRTNYYTIRADLINLGIIKGKIKQMHHITNEEEKEIIRLYKKGHNPTQIAEWIRTSSLKRENYPGVVRVLRKHNLIKEK